MFEDGESISRIARHFHVNRITVYKKLKKLGKQPRYLPIKLIQAQSKESQIQTEVTQEPPEPIRILPEESQNQSEKVQEISEAPKTTPQNFLSVPQYSKKYGVVPSVLYRLIKKGRIIYKMLHRKLYIFDAPPEQHQLTNVDLNSNVKSNANFILPHPGTSNVNEKRKARLREEFLPIFLEKVSPDKMTFSTKEVLELLNLNTKTLRDWRSWGLKNRPIPKGYRHLAEGQQVHGDSYYFRKDLYDFLSGNIETSEWKKNTTDDVFIGAATGTNTPDGQFFKYDPALCYPINSEGFFAWLKDKKIVVRESGTGKMREFIPNERQKEFFVKALEVDANGLYKNHIVFACYPRGEGKSTMVIIIALFRFFNMRFEKIYVTADSREHAVSLTYDRMKEIIQDTDALKNTAGLEVKEKEISLYASDKNPICQIKPIPKSVGLYPGLTCVLMTELHKTDDNDKRFITDLWSSTRATRNAMILCDTTVAEPGHIVHEVWEKHQKSEVPKLFFDYYCDRIYNPETTPEYLASMRAVMPEADYNRYFRNRWQDAIGGFFPKNKIQEIEVLMFKGILSPSYGLSDAIEKAGKLKEQKKIYEKGKVNFANIEQQIKDIEKDFTSIDTLYKLPATNTDLEKIAKQYGVNFIIGVGLDRASFTGVTPDRTVLTCVARGLVSSEISYYFILDVFIPKESTLPVLTEKILEWSLEYGRLDRIIVETYQAQDFYYWCKEKGYESEIVSATPKIQYPLFMNLYQIINQGYLKCPSKVPYYTDNEGNYFHGFINIDDIMREEMGVFTYKSGDEAKGAKFYSPQKRLKGGIKDDVMFSLGWAIYATQSDMLIPSGVRGERPKLGSLIINTDVVGDYV